MRIFIVLTFRSGLLLEMNQLFVVVNNSHNCLVFTFARSMSHIKSGFLFFQYICECMKYLSRDRNILKGPKIKKIIMFSAGCRVLLHLYLRINPIHNSIETHQLKQGYV